MVRTLDQRFNGALAIIKMIGISVAYLLHFAREIDMTTSTGWFWFIPFGTEHGVAVFMVVTGYVMTYKTFADGKSFQLTTRLFIKRWLQIGIPCAIAVLIEWSFYRVGLRAQSDFPKDSSFLQALFAGLVCPIAGIFFTLKYVYSLSMLMAIFHMSIFSVIVAKVFTDVCNENLIRFLLPTGLLYLILFQLTFGYAKFLFASHAAVLGVLLAWHHARHKPKIQKLFDAVIMLSVSILAFFSFIFCGILHGKFGWNVVLPTEWQFIVQSISAVGLIHSTSCNDDYDAELEEIKWSVLWMERLSFPVYLCHLQILQAVGLPLVIYLQSNSMLNYWTIWFVVIEVTTVVIVVFALLLDSTLKLVTANVSTVVRYVRQK